MMFVAAFITGLWTFVCVSLWLDAEEDDRKTSSSDRKKSAREQRPRVAFWTGLTAFFIIMGIFGP